MKRNPGKSGLTLPETAVVVAIIAMLAAFGLPAIRALLNSFESHSGATTMISAALTSARAIAAREQRYAGIRFQQDSAGDQYMIYIVHDFEKTGLSPGFRAVEGLKPIKLPQSLGAMDLMVRTNHGTQATAAADPMDEPLKPEYLDDANPLNLGPDLKNKYLRDISTFSIVFSPAGKLVVRTVRVRNKNGIYQPDNSLTNKASTDGVFNSPANITTYGIGTFAQDDYAELGLGVETSRNSFIVYDRVQFDKLDAQKRFTYLSGLKPIYINSYTGTMILPN